MPSTRYALFTPVPDLGGGPAGSHGGVLDVGFERRGIAPYPDRPAGGDAMDASDLGSPATLTFKTPAEAARAGRDGSRLLRVPRMPVRLIPQGVADGGGVGSPWGIEAIGASRSAFTGAGVCVAVLDSGIDTAHPAFSGLSFGAGNHRDFTGTGLADTIGHGTHCAGIIFGRDVGGTRIGVARGVTSVLIGKVADRHAVTTTEQLEEAIQWAVREGADIISLSVGLDFQRHARELRDGRYPPDAAIAAALADYADYARFFDNLMGRVINPGTAGSPALVIAAVGNDSAADGDPAYRVGATVPANSHGVISVGALASSPDYRLTVASISNAGASVCAPGVSILSSVPGGGLGSLSGTSQAAPHVAGAAALWWECIRVEQSRRPPVDTVRERMLGLSDFGALSPPATADEIGSGLVSVP